MRMSDVDRETLARDLLSVYTKQDPNRYLRSFDNLPKLTQERWLAMADFVLSRTEDKPEVYLELGE